MMAIDKIQVLCYGDSNTWGCIGKWVESDEPSARYDADTRWPTVLQQELGENFHVIEEGLGVYANPSSILKAEAMLLRHICCTEEAQKLEDALSKCQLVVTGTADGATCADFANELVTLL